MPREDLPVIDTVLLRLPRVAEHQPPLEFVQIAADFFAPLASRFQMNGAGSAKSGRIVVLRAGGHADHDGFRVTADVNPVLETQLCAGEPVERRANGHGHGARTADSRAGGRLGIGGQRQAHARPEKSHQMSQQRQPISLRALQRRERSKCLFPLGIPRNKTNRAPRRRFRLDHA